MQTLKQLIELTERSLQVDKDTANGIRDNARNEKRELTNDENYAITLIEGKIEAAKGNLERLRAAKAEEDEVNRKMQETHPTGAGVTRSGSFKADGTSLTGV